MFRIWVPKKIIETVDPLAHVMRVKGRYQLRAGSNGRITRVSPWFDNLITNSGLDRIAVDAVYLSKVYVGTGTAAPANTDTALGALVASTTTLQSSARATNASTPYELTVNVTLRFAEGVAAGNLTEVGIGPTSGNIFSRALIVDGGGSPTTFPVAANEFLDVAYQLTVYPPLSDSTGNVTITNVGTISYTSRACLVGPGNWFTLGYGGVGGFIDTGNSGVGAGVAYAGSIGAITGQPTGSSSSSSGASNDAYVSGNYFRTCVINWDLNSGNVGGILSVRHLWGTNVAVSTLDRTSMTFQTQYGATINKTASYLLALAYKLSWARA